MIYLLVLDVLDCIDVPDSYCTSLLVLYILTRTAHIFIREFWKKGLKFGSGHRKGGQFWHLISVHFESSSTSIHFNKLLGVDTLNLKECQRPCRFICVTWEQKKYLWPLPTTLKNRQRLAVIQFCVKSSNLNEDSERPLTTMNDFQQPWKTANDC